MKIKKKQVFIVIGIVLVLYGLGSGIFLALTDYVPNYETYTFLGTDGSNVIKEGATSAVISYGGHSYTLQVRTVPDFAGYGAAAFYEDNVQIGGTVQSTAPNCPPCTDYYPSVYQITDTIKGSILCYTGTDGQTFCYAKIYFSTSTVPLTCTVDGIVYNDGDQVKIVNGCYSTFTGEACYDNYQFSTCSGGVLMGVSICYPGVNCGMVVPGCTNTCLVGQTQSPYPFCTCSESPTPSCETDETKVCETTEGCIGTQTCSNGVWGACMKDDPDCGSDYDMRLLPWGIAIIGMLMIIYGMTRK